MRLAGIEPAESSRQRGATGSVSDKLPAWALVAAVGTGAAVDGSQGESAWGRRGRKQGSIRVEPRALANVRRKGRFAPPIRGTGFDSERLKRRAGTEGKVDGGRRAPNRQLVTRCRFQAPRIFCSTLATTTADQLARAPDNRARRARKARCGP